MPEGNLAAAQPDPNKKLVKVFDSEQESEENARQFEEPMKVVTAEKNSCGVLPSQSARK